MGVGDWHVDERGTILADTGHPREPLVLTPPPAEEWPDWAVAMVAFQSVVDTPGHYRPHYGEPVFHDDGAVTVEGTTYEWVPTVYRSVEVGRVERPE